MKSKNTAIFFIILILIFSDFYSYVGFSLVQRKIFYLFGIVILLWSFLESKLNRGNRNRYFERYIDLLIFVPWLSVIPAFLSHAQPVGYSILVLVFPTLVLMFYYFLHFFKISEHDILKYLLLFSIIYTIIEVFQQQTYPFYLFAGRDELENTGEHQVRLGLYKFYITGIHLVVLSICFRWNKLVDKFSALNVSLLIILLVGLYYFLARKMVFSMIFVFALTPVIRNKLKLVNFILFLIIGIVGYLIVDLYLGEFLTETTEDLSDGDFVRFKSAQFYLFYFDDPLTFLLGNGRPHSFTQYGQYLNSLYSKFGMHWADVGIIAYFSFHGFFGILVVISFATKVKKVWNILPLYIKIFWLYTLLQTFIAFPLNTILGAFNFALVVYLMDCHINKNILLKV